MAVHRCRSSKRHRDAFWESPGSCIRHVATQHQATYASWRAIRRRDRIWPHSARRHVHVRASEPILSQRQVPSDVGEILEHHKFLRQLVDDHRRYAWDLMAEQFNQHHQYYDRAELPHGSYAYVLAKHLTSDEQRAGLADASKLRDRYWGPYKVLKIGSIPLM